MNDAPPTLADRLAEEGLEPAPGQVFVCETCPPARRARGVPAYALQDVRHLAGVPQDFMCGLCIVDRSRPAVVIAGVFAALTTPLDWSAVVAERRRILNATVWALAEDGTVTAEERATWTAYRVAVAAVGPDTFASPGAVTWPTAPG